MKSLSFLKTLAVLLVLVLPNQLFAQNDVGELFKSSPQDATRLVDAYMNPLFKGMGLGLNSGWTNTAKAKNFLKFDLRFTATAAFVPEKDRTFNAGALNLTTIKPATGSNGIGPTAFGDNNQGDLMEIYTTNGTKTGQTFNLPEGTGLKFVPAPQVQLTVGLPKNIDVTLRLVPNINLGEDIGKIKQFGLGAKAEILPLIMGTKAALIPFDVAVALGFTNTTYTL